MFQDFLRHDEIGLTVGDAVPRRSGWSVLLPFFNERDCIADTVASLARQDERPLVILIDNASTDGSAELAVAACRDHDVPYVLVHERRPGKVAALAAGLACVTTPFVATCDADTWYPAHYLATAQTLLERPGVAAAGAFFVARAAGTAQRVAAALHVKLIARLLPSQCHAGGAGQVFRTAALRGAGGFDPQRWNLVLEDHEIIHRVLKHGAMGYSTGLWCSPSPRKRDRASVRWTLAERLCYIAAAAAQAGDWFFYNHLAGRLAARQLSSDRLRERRYQRATAPAVTFAPAVAA